jgi:hypothetical protein
MSLLLRIAALVLFIVAAVGLWVTDLAVGDAAGLVACGLGAWVASTLPLGPAG